MSISEIITASGQYPSTFCSLCDNGPGKRCSHMVRPEGSSLVPGSVCVFLVCVCESLSVLYSTYTHAHTGYAEMGVWKCERVILSLLYLGERRP